VDGARGNQGDELGKESGSDTLRATNNYRQAMLFDGLSGKTPAKNERYIFRHH
jgi:hypothetical protein